MNETTSNSIAVELITESSWIFGRIAHEQTSNVESLKSLLNLGDYQLAGRSLLESGRLVDVLNRGSPYLALTGAWIQPHFPIELLDRTLDQLAINIGEILFATPPERTDTPAPAATPRPAPNPDSRRERRRVELQIGPILVRGFLHVIPGADPVAFYFNQRTFVPLTDALAIYLPDQDRQWRREVVCVNTHRTQFVVPTGTEDEDAQLAVLRNRARA